MQGGLGMIMIMVTMTWSQYHDIEHNIGSHNPDDELKMMMMMLSSVLEFERIQYTVLIHSIVLALSSVQ